MSDREERSLISEWRTPGSGLRDLQDTALRHDNSKKLVRCHHDEWRLEVVMIDTADDRCVGVGVQRCTCNLCMRGTMPSAD